MRTMAAGAFKAQCLSVMDEVASKREPVLITKRGKPVAKVVPVDAEPEDIFGFASARLKIAGEIVGPIVPSEEWEVLK